MGFHVGLVCPTAIWALTSFIFSVDGACVNTKGDAYCADRLSRANFCYLASTDTCGCEKDCKAPAYCNEPTNVDSSCDCPFNAPYCDQQWLRDYCNTTCSLRFSVSCDPLIQITGASPLFNGNAPPSPSTPPLYMDFVTFTCDPGWEQTSGNSSNSLRRVCVADGSWVLHPDFQEPLVCERKSCGPSPSVANATSSQSVGVFGDTVTYTCDLGHNNTGQGQGNRTCNVSAQWEQTDNDPVCEAVQCGAPPNLPMATPSATSGSYLSVILYTCHSGYYQAGPGIGWKQCNVNGQWVPLGSDPNIICLPKPCPALPDIPNAVPSRPSGVYRDIVTYSCDLGYNQSGGSDGKRTCTADGTWFVENAEPVCTPVSCGASPSIFGAQASASSGTYGDVINYTCATGYNQSESGTGRRTCNATGSWEVNVTDTDPNCTPVSCGAVPSLASINAEPSSSSGTYGDVITYTCVTGYSQSGGGNGRRTCSPSGSWDIDGGDSNPVCSPVSCGPAPVVNNAAASQSSGTFGVVVTYSCAAGYNQSGGGTGSRECQSSGGWAVHNNDSDPVCTGVSCGAPPTRIGATPSAAIGYLGDNVTYTCDQSHVSVGGGSGHVTCNASGLWEEDSADSVPLCLGMNVRFANSKSQVQVAPPNSLTSTSARSNLHCASFCASSVHCHGYSFRKHSGVCEMNIAAPNPVITVMKKVYF